MRFLRFAFVLPFFLIVSLALRAQDKSVRPGINKPFEDPKVNVKEYIAKFEIESREVFTKRKQIVEVCRLKPGMAVADVGAGTGLFTRPFAAAVGEKGKVYAVDIVPKFIKHIEETCAKDGIKNVKGILCNPTSAELPNNSVDLVFICDTYHHFEFPYRTMTSIHRALRLGGKVVVVDFQRIEGKSRDWILNHVRAGQETVVKEIVSCGFKKVGEEKLLEENYLVLFEKVDEKK